MKREFSLMSLLLIPIGIALNFVLGSLAKTLNLPIFLDSVGTVLAGILGGPIVGLVTGFLGVLSISAFAPAAVVWSVQAGVIGVIVGLLARFGWFRGRRIVGATLIIVAVSVTLSALISILVFGGFDGYGISVLRAALVEAGFSMPAAVVTTSAVAELIDKSLSVAVPLLVMKGMSDRFLNKFPNGPHLRDLVAEPAVAPTRPMGTTTGSIGTSEPRATSTTTSTPTTGTTTGTTTTGSTGTAGTNTTGGYGSYGAYDEPEQKN